MGSGYCEDPILKGKRGLLACTCTDTEADSLSVIPPSASLVALL